MDTSTFITLLLLLAVLSTQAHSARFITIPVSVNASLGSTTYFKCTVQGGLPHWHINGRKLSGIQFLSQRGISSNIVGSGGIRTSSLSILASVANNNSAVQCSISDGFTEVLFSPTVEMKVQGALAAPANLHVVFINTTTIHLRWEPPFTLIITDTSKPEISNYLVQITNLNTGNVTRVNVTASEYFVLADRDCITYEVHVLAVNDVGEGNLSESVIITSLGDTAFSGPFSVKVAVGELTSVNCTVPCTDVITWYTTQYPYTLRQPLSLLTSYTSAASHCTTDLSNTTEMYTEVLVIVATEDINETLLQCASMNVNDQRNAPKYKPWSGVCFSGFAEIIVDPLKSSAVGSSLTLLPSPSFFPNTTVNQVTDEATPWVYITTVLGQVLGVYSGILTVGILVILSAVLMTRHCSKKAHLTVDNTYELPATIAKTENIVYEELQLCPTPHIPQQVNMKPCPAYRGIVHQ